MGEIFIGTSGFYFPDWAGRFYPAGLPRNKWLSYYTRYFDALELNATFYRIPKKETAKSLSSILPNNFHLIVKIPQSITHKFDRNKWEYDISKLQEYCHPLEQKGDLKGFLAQFPGSFHRNFENERTLKEIISQLPKPLFVEFRHISWLSDEIQETLAKHSVGWVIPDVPRINGLMPNTPIVIGEVAYIRFHGRNKDGWYSGQRYNYLYSKEEMNWILDLARNLAKEKSKIYIFFNNCYMAQGVANAIHLAKMLGKISDEPILFNT